jgi:hypothetical protein
MARATTAQKSRHKQLRTAHGTGYWETELNGNNNKNIYTHHTPGDLLNSVDPSLTAAVR